MYMYPNPIKPPALPAPKYTPPYSYIMQGTGRCIIEQYLGMYVYVWLLSSEAFWMCPKQIKDGIVYGFVWRSYKWTFSSFPQLRIDCIY